MKIGTIVAALVGGLVMFGLGFLLFGVLLSDYFKANTTQYAGLMKDKPVIWAIFLFNVVWAWLIAFVLSRGAAAGAAEGAKTGAIVMFVLGLGINLEYHAFMNVHPSIAPVLVSMLVVTFLGVVAGAVIGLVLGYFNKK